MKSPECGLSLHAHLNMEHTEARADCILISKRNLFIKAEKSTVN